MTGIILLYDTDTKRGRIRAMEQYVDYEITPETQVEGVLTTGTRVEFTELNPHTRKTVYSKPTAGTVLAIAPAKQTRRKK